MNESSTLVLTNRANIAFTHHSKSDISFSKVYTITLLHI